ncbi:hypothetical protein RHGRI_003635 [Rhododendron griersonianum]|uniref:Uncharacterized protein n=1 Tax=Rhododendron griersonianum TaxID=479676 RepID=A0AAV6L6L3_9ERIC|nr:hypothetical protein RHGRI_003635 [Rhododendron griersonianum]
MVMQYQGSNQSMDDPPQNQEDDDIVDPAPYLAGDSALLQQQQQLRKNWSEASDWRPRGGGIMRMNNQGFEESNMGFEESMEMTTCFYFPPSPTNFPLYLPMPSVFFVSSEQENISLALSYRHILEDKSGALHVLYKEELAEISQLLFDEFDFFSYTDNKFGDLHTMAMEAGVLPDDVDSLVDDILDAGYNEREVTFRRINWLEQKDEDNVDQLVFEVMAVVQQLIQNRGGELDVILGGGVFTLNGLELRDCQDLPTTPETLHICRAKLSYRVWLGHGGQWAAEVRCRYNSLNIGSFTTVEDAMSAYEEFYKNMVVPEPGHFLAPGARITSRIGNTPVFVDVAEIATALDYQRPTRPVNFPRPDETFDQNEIAGYLYEHRKNARIPHWPGRFTTAYRFINQVVCFNLYPRGREGAPQRSVGNLMYAFMGEDTVSDWALYIFGQMCDFRDAPTTLRMPFPCLVTKILRTRNVPGKRFYSNDDLLPGDLDSSFIHRSMAQLRGMYVCGSHSFGVSHSFPHQSRSRFLALSSSLSLHPSIDLRVFCQSRVSMAAPTNSGESDMATEDFFSNLLSLPTPRLSPPRHVLPSSSSMVMQYQECTQSMDNPPQNQEHDDIVDPPPDLARDSALLPQQLLFCQSRVSMAAPTNSGESDMATEDFFSNLLSLPTPRLSPPRHVLPSSSSMVMQYQECTQSMDNPPQNQEHDDIVDPPPDLARDSALLPQQLLFCQSRVSMAAPTNSGESDMATEDFFSNLLSLPTPRLSPPRHVLPSSSSMVMQYQECTQSMDNPPQNQEHDDIVDPPPDLARDSALLPQQLLFCQSRVSMAAPTNSGESDMATEDFFSNLLSLPTPRLSPPRHVLPSSSSMVMQYQECTQSMDNPPQNQEHDDIVDPPPDLARDSALLPQQLRKNNQGFEESNMGFEESMKMTTCFNFPPSSPTYFPLYPPMPSVFYVSTNIQDISLEWSYPHLVADKSGVFHVINREEGNNIFKLLFYDIYNQILHGFQSRLDNGLRLTEMEPADVNKMIGDYIMEADIDKMFEVKIRQINGLEQHDHEDIVDQPAIELLGLVGEVEQLIQNRGGELGVIIGGAVFNDNGREWREGSPTTSETLHICRAEYSARVQLGHSGQWVIENRFRCNRLNIGKFTTVEDSISTYEMDNDDDFLIACDDDLLYHISHSRLPGTNSIEFRLALFVMKSGNREREREQQC